MKVKGRGIAKGVASGEVLLSKEAISFLGGVDPKSGKVVEKGHPLEGKSIAGKVLVFPRGKGSTVGTYVIFQLKKNGKAPAAIVNVESEIIVAVGAILAEIPMIDMLEGDGYARLKNGMKVKVDGSGGFVEVGP